MYRRLLRFNLIKSLLNLKWINPTTNIIPWVKTVANAAPFTPRPKPGIEVNGITSNIKIGFKIIFNITHIALIIVGIAFFPWADNTEEYM